MSRKGLHHLATTGATDGDVPTYDASVDRLVYAAPTGGGDGGGTPTFHGCKAVKAVAQGSASGADTYVQFEAANVYDTDSMHDPATNNTRITIPAGLGGYWRFTGTVVWAASGTGSRVVQFAVNGAKRGIGFGGQRIGANGSVSYFATSSIDLLLAAGDYVELVAQQDAGSLNVTAASFSAHLIGV